MQNNGSEMSHWLWSLEAKTHNSISDDDINFLKK